MAKAKPRGAEAPAGKAAKKKIAKKPQPAAAPGGGKRAIDAIFASGQAKKRERAAAAAEAEVAARGAEAAAAARKAELQREKKQKARKRTEEGYRIFHEDELKINRGGGTPLCPFDCQSCF